MLLLERGTCWAGGVDEGTGGVVCLLMGALRHHWLVVLVWGQSQTPSTLNSDHDGDRDCGTVAESYSVAT